MSFVLVAVSVLLASQDPVALVRQLGSDRFAEREEAGEALRKLGRDALPALRQAADNDDLEARTRALAILAELESRIMVEPTMVRLDFRDQSVADIVKSLSEQARITLMLTPENHPEWSNRRISLEESEPVALWEAIERLTRAARMQVGPGTIQMIAGQGQPVRRSVIQLLPSDELPPPSAVAGAFRVNAVNILHHRDRIFGQGQAAGNLIVNPNGVIVSAPRKPGAGGDNAPDRPAVAGFATELFSVGLQVSAEPRMAINQNGSAPIRVLEAIDEQGRSLVPPADPAFNQRSPGMSGYNPFSGSLLQVQIPLRLSESPGSLVKKLRVAIPLVAASRKEDPFVVPLAEAKGKTFQNDRIMIQIHDVRAELNQPTTFIDLTVRIHSDDSGNPNLINTNVEAMAFRHHPGAPQNQVEIVDAQGRPYSQWFSPNPQPSNDGLRLTLRLMPAEGVGPPSEIRYYDIARAETEVTFEINDIPMP